MLTHCYETQIYTKRFSIPYSLLCHDDLYNVHPYIHTYIHTILVKLLGRTICIAMYDHHTHVHCCYNVITI